MHIYFWSTQAHSGRVLLVNKAHCGSYVWPTPAYSASMWFGAFAKIGFLKLGANKIYEAHGTTLCIIIHSWSSESLKQMAR